MIEPADTSIRPRPDGFESAQWQLPHPAPFWCELIVSARHLSRSIPHVSNVEYVRWLDRAAELHADSLGFTRQSLLNRGVMWFVARHEIDYLAEAWEHDELAIATWVRNVRKVKTWRDSAIVRLADRSVICRASTLWVLVDLGTRRPIRLTDDMLAGFAPLETLLDV